MYAIHKGLTERCILSKQCEKIDKKLYGKLENHKLLIFIRKEAER